MDELLTHNDRAPDVGPLRGPGPRRQRGRLAAVAAVAAMALLSVGAASAAADVASPTGVAAPMDIGIEDSGVDDFLEWF